MDVLQRDTVVGNLPGGKYFIGDPKYTMDRKLQDEFFQRLYAYTCATLPKLVFNNGIIIEFKGCKCFLCSTNNHGTGPFKDQMHRVYKCDSSIIGAIPIELVNSTEAWKSGHLFETPNKFTVAADQGFYPDYKDILVAALRIRT